MTIRALVLKFSIALLFFFPLFAHSNTVVGDGGVTIAGRNVNTYPNADTSILWSDDFIDNNIIDSRVIEHWEPGFKLKITGFEVLYRDGSVVVFPVNERNPVRFGNAALTQICLKKDPVSGKSFPSSGAPLNSCRVIQMPVREGALEESGVKPR